MFFTQGIVHSKNAIIYIADKKGAKGLEMTLFQVNKI